MTLIEYSGIALLGWISGVLVNYLSDVLPYKRRLTTPFCIYCGDSMAFQNYIFFPRKCRECGSLRSRRTLIVEIVYIIFSIWIWTTPPENIGYSLGMILAIYFGIITVIDVEHHLILHAASIFGAILFSIIGMRLHGLQSTIVGGVLGFLIMLGFYFLGIGFVRLSMRLRKTSIEEVEGLGFGDVNLSGVLGLLLGWPGIIAGLIMAILIGGVISLIYILVMLINKKYQPSLALPYGPFLIAGAAFLLYFRQYIIGS